MTLSQPRRNFRRGCTRPPKRFSIAQPMPEGIVTQNIFVRRGLGRGPQQAEKYTRSASAVRVFFVFVGTQALLAPLLGAYSRWLVYNLSAIRRDICFILGYLFSNSILSINFSLKTGLPPSLTETAQPAIRFASACSLLF